MRRLLSILALPAAMLAGCTAAAPLSSSSASASPSPSVFSEPPTTSPTTEAAVVATTSAVSRCHTGDLKVTAAYGDGAAGHYSINLRFTNRSGHTCTLYGYPGVSWVTGDNGTQVNDPFQRVSETKKTITLKPGATGHAMVVEVQVGFFDEKVCKPVSVRGYRVYPPDETAAIFVSSPEKACSAKGIGVGQVYPIVSGTGTNH
jgi:hypothetical protein